MLDIAARLNKSIAEVESWPVAHLAEWVAYFRLQNDEEFQKDLAEKTKEDLLKRIQSRRAGG